MFPGVLLSAYMGTPEHIQIYLEFLKEALMIQSTVLRYHLCINDFKTNNFCHKLYALDNRKNTRTTVNPKLKSG